MIKKKLSVRKLKRGPGWRGGAWCSCVNGRSMAQTLQCEVKAGFDAGIRLVFGARPTPIAAGVGGTGYLRVIVGFRTCLFGETRRYQ